MMWDFYKDETLGDYIDSRLFDDREPISNKLDIAQQNAQKYADDTEYKQEIDDRAGLEQETNTKEDLTKDTLLNPKRVEKIIYDKELELEGRLNKTPIEKPVVEAKKEEPKKDNNVELKAAKIIESLAKRVKNKEAMDILNRLQEKVDAQESAKKNQIIDKETGIRDKVQERRNSGNYSNEEWSKIFKNLMKK